ncbi:nucleotide-binding protein (plasmid) [Arthrobacter sp. KN11-1C]|uniref:nucleotide-binding protein n=1 Tax=Arthrobacter sp. KN11-1C TaxID=3445774 RepID=UPI003FA014A0
MTSALPHVKVFIGSSTEGLKIARTLQAELESATGCTVNRWDIATFAPGSLTLDALISEANEVDFAILVATGEDTITTRGTETAAVRDNIIFEFGLFLGALGRERVYLLSVGNAKLPSDLLGLTRLMYRERPDGNVRAALNDAVVRAEDAITKLGPRARGSQPKQQWDTGSIVAKVAKDALAELQLGEDHAHQSLAQNTQAPAAVTRDVAAGSLATSHAEQTLKALDAEIDWLCSNATNQGWLVIKSNPTMLRLGSPKGREFTLQRRRPGGTRSDLRKFVTELRANGLRVNRALQGAVEDSPFG